MNSTLPGAYAPSIIGPGTKGTIVSSGEYRRATHPKERLRGEGELFATLRPVTHTPAVWDPILAQNTKHRKDYLVRDSLFACLPGDDLLCQGLAPQVSSALEVLTSVFGMGTGGTPPA